MSVRRAGQDQGGEGRQAPLRERGGAAMIVDLGPRTAHVSTADGEIHWALDREGRLLAGHQGGAHHRVALDGAVVSRAPGPGVAPRRLSSSEGVAVLSCAADVLGEARARLALREAPLRITADLDPTGAHATALALLERAAGRAARPDAERAAFAAVYGPVRMIPPDAAQALVVQLTEGCSWGRCSFCTLYADVPFRLKSPGEAAAHLDGVAALFGAGAALRRGVFLGDANALLVPMESLLGVLTAVRARFPDAARGGAHAFVDAFSGRGRTEAELRALREAGLRRITIGLESGCADLLLRLRKPSTPDRVRELVGRARRAGLSLGVTVLAGLGGDELGREHVADTIDVVRGLGLGAGDLVFLSPLAGPAGGGVAALGPEEAEAQAAQLQAGLEGGPWRVALYDLRRSIY